MCGRSGPRKGKKTKKKKRKELDQQTVGVGDTEDLVEQGTWREKMQQATTVGLLELRLRRGCSHRDSEGLGRGVSG